MNITFSLIYFKYSSTECTKTTIYQCLQMIYLILKEKKNNLITISVAITTQKLTEKTLYAMHIKWSDKNRTQNLIAV